MPNYYSGWFLNRLKEGYFDVRNPMNPHQISRIETSPDLVDCIVFWTKNPLNLMGRLNELREYMYYFQFTLTGYSGEVEPNLPDKKRVLVPAFQNLSETLGKERVIWRYDPVFFSKNYTMQFHLKAFGELASMLKGYTQRVVISFLDLYAKIKRNMAELGLEEISEGDYFLLARQMAEIAAENHMQIETCSEGMDLTEFGIRRGSCIDKELIERLTGAALNGKKDKCQRDLCECLESVEVGTYHTCLTGCRYCYANFSDKKVKDMIKGFQPDSSLLCGSIQPEDKLTIRKVRTLRK